LVRATSTPDTATSTVEDTVRSIAEELPDPVKEKAIPLLRSAEEFRLRQAKDASERAERFERAITEAGATTSAALSTTTTLHTGWKTLVGGAKALDVAKSPFAYFKLFLALVSEFLFTNTYAFYIATALMFFWLLRFVIGIFR